MGDAPSEHRALAVVAPPGESEFDFLAQRPGYRRRQVQLKWILRVSATVVLITLFILVIVDLNSSGDDNGDAKAKEFAYCFFPLGGGDVGSVLPQSQLSDPRCVDLFDGYFAEDGEYWRDTENAVRDAAPLLEREGNGTQMVIFDIDETSLSNLGLYQKSQWQSSAEERHRWQTNANCTAIPAVLNFYLDLRQRGFAVAFITGRGEDVRQGTEQNLRAAGFGIPCTRSAARHREICYIELVMRREDSPADATIYKGLERGKLIDEGYELIASIGDQWSDLLGAHRPPLLIKMPNPLYYLP